MNFTPDDMERLERAIVEGCRVQLTRRGTEYVVTPSEISSSGSVDTLVGLTSIGDRLSFPLPDIDDFVILW